jgi:hypothetical protein
VWNARTVFLRKEFASVLFFQRNRFSFVNLFNCKSLPVGRNGNRAVFAGRQNFRARFSIFRRLPVVRMSELRFSPDGNDSEFRFRRFDKFLVEEVGFRDARLLPTSACRNSGAFSNSLSVSFSISPVSKNFLSP